MMQEVQVMLSSGGCDTVSSLLAQLPITGVISANLLAAVKVEMCET